MRHLTAISSALAIGVGIVAVTAAVGAPPGAGQMIWNDEFAGASVDASKWQCNEPGLWGDAINTPNAATVSNGSMKISTYTNPSTGKHHSALMGTQDTFLATYGYYEARINFHSSPGMWSAFWLMSPTIARPLGAPEQAGVEIDIVEHRSTNNAGQDISNKYFTALHWDGYGDAQQSVGHTNGPVAGLANDTWHTYGLMWTPTSYTMYIDDRPMWTQTSPISHARQYIMLSSEVDDNFWSGSIPAGGYGSQATSTTNMLVDYVRVYDLSAVPEPASAAVAGVALAGLCARRRARG